jgi:replication-associated recombination protein RarA
MMTTIRPGEYRPRTAEQFIGGARQRCIELTRKIDLLRKNDGFFRGMFYGDPGVGKSELALALAFHATGHELAIEQYNGQDVTVEMVREWRRSAVGSLFSRWTARIIDEWDRMNEAAQALFLTLLDLRLKRCIYIVTTNKPLQDIRTREPKDGIPERDQTRMQLYKFSRVGTQELADWLVNQWGAPPGRAVAIAEANHGNVRGALLDWERDLDRLEVAAA